MMNGNRVIRVIKRGQRQELTASAAPPVENDKEPVESARRVKTVVSAWVREWQERSAQRRPTLNSLFQGA